MHKCISGFMLAFLLSACHSTSPTNTAMIASAGPVNYEKPQAEIKTLHDFTAKTLLGDDFDFATLKGKRVLIVNTASECGYTPQYKQLQDLYQELGGENFTVIGFPSNDFGRQESGSSKEIAAFCEKNFGITFPMMDKIAVKGKDQHPVYAWLTQKEQNGVSDAKVKWNFNKFLVDEQGRWVAYFPSGTSPLDDEIVAFAEGK